jgi:hypothetical protein
MMMHTPETYETRCPIDALTLAAADSNTSSCYKLLRSYMYRVLNCSLIDVKKHVLKHLLLGSSYMYRVLNCSLIDVNYELHMLMAYTNLLNWYMKT